MSIASTTKLFGRHVTCVALCVALLSVFEQSSVIMACEQVTGRAIVQMKFANSLAAAQTDLGSGMFTVIHIIDDETRSFVVSFAETLLVSDVVDSLKNLSTVYFAEQMCLPTNFFIPNDFYFELQHGFYNADGRHDIHAPEAWDVTSGKASTLGGGNPTVAIVDNGFDRDHEDLESNFWINPGEDLNGNGVIEPNEVNNLDDDGNELIDDFYGWDFIGNDNNLPEETHGTQVTGQIAARGNNEIGVAGVSWFSKIIPTAATHNQEGQTYLDALVYARNLRDLYDNSAGQFGAYVVAVNRSQGETEVLCEEASAANQIISTLGDRGILTTIAAGNLNQQPNNQPNIDHPDGHISPQTCPSEYTIVVMASWQADAELPGSCYGGWEDETHPYTQSVDLAAPGFQQWTTDLNDTYAAPVGTSFSAPKVAGTASLLHSVPNPSFYEYYRNDPASGAATVKTMILGSVDSWTGPTDHNLTNGRLNIGEAVSAMCNFYYDNGHAFQSQITTATSPSGTPNFASGRGNHAVYFDGSDVFYWWNQNCDGIPRIYKLSSEMQPGSQPAIISAEETNATEVYMTWLGGPDGVTVLQHKLLGTCIPSSVYSQEWRMAKLDVAAPSGVGVVLSTPLVFKETGTIPVVLLAVSGGTNPGVHFWRAPDELWYDFQPWTHGVVPLSAGDNVTSVSSYVWEDTDELDQIHVAWTTDEDEVHFIKGTQTGTTYVWDNFSHAVLSNQSAINLRGVSYCYSLDLEGGFCAWEGTNIQLGQQNIFLAHGKMDGFEIDWQPAYQIDGLPDCINRRAPHLHPYKDAVYNVPAGYCRVGLVYERQYDDELFARIECRGLQINEQDPDDVQEWTWLPPIDRLLGRQPTILEWGAGGFGLFYTEDGSTAPYELILDNVSLTYNVPLPPLPPEDVITSSQVWYTPLTLDRSINVGNGGSLVITSLPDCPDDPTVQFNNNASINVEAGGFLAVDGVPGKRIRFQCSDPTKTWAGIYVNQGRLDMEWAEFYHATPYTVHTDKPVGSSTPVAIDHCYFNGGSQATGGAVLLLWDSPTLMHKVTNSTVENVSNGYGLYLYNCNVDFQGDTIRNCSYANSYIKKVTGKFRSCVFHGRATFYGLMTSMATCTPDFKCCMFTDLAPISGSFQTSIFCGQGTVPTFGGENYLTGVSNVTDDSSAYLFVIEGSGVLPVIDANPSVLPVNGGHNDWKQRKSTGKLIEWRNRTTTAIYKCEDQFWNTTPNNNLFSPTGAFDYTPHHLIAWGLCGGAGSGPMAWKPPEGREVPHEGSGLDDGEEDLYDLALQLEDSGLYAEALDLFHIVATSSPDLNLRWYATTHAVTTEAFVGNGSWIPALIDSLVIADSTYDTRIYGNRVLANYYLNHQEYQDGIDVCADLLNSGLTYTDSIYVSIDLLSIEMAAGLVPFGGLDAGNIPAGLRVGTLAEGLAREGQLLSLLGGEGTQQPGHTLIPREYHLYQNYSNPFNPLTEIRFDLPENTQVELAIFNTLGQKVATLIDEARVAGSYRVQWDGRGAASGVYLYRLKAGSFVETKKMILMR